jgi:hypothetical protein
VVKQIKKSLAKISLQLDESTDVSNCAQLLTLALYMHQNEKNFFHESLGGGKGNCHYKYAEQIL